MDQSDGEIMSCITERNRRESESPLFFSMNFEGAEAPHATEKDSEFLRHFSTISLLSGAILQPNTAHLRPSGINRLHTVYRRDLAAAQQRLADATRRLGER